MSTKERYSGLQTRLDGIDSDGCYFLSLVSIAEEVNGGRVDLVDAVNKATAAGLVKDRFTVQSTEGLLAMLTGKKWARTDSKTLPKEIPDEMYTVEVWKNPRTGFTHFRRRGFDTLASSVTVREGRLDHYRILVWR